MNEPASTRHQRFGQQVVVVTGASAGVGRATALAFAREGARVALLARGAEGLQSAEREIELAGGGAWTRVVDVADAAAVEDAADAIERELGPIAVWVNNAMVTIFAPVHAIEPDEFKRATEVTYLGGVYGTMAALKRMRARDRGTIVQVSSALAHRSIPLQSAYCGAKHALVGFLDALRSELIHDGSHVHLTSVELPALNTPQFGWARNKLPHRPQPVPPVFHPELAADAIVWAAAHRRRSVTVGAPTWLAVWGQKFFPGLLDRFLARSAWQGQQTDQADDHARPDNLYAPVAGDPGVHGPFGARARSGRALLTAQQHPALLLAAAAGIGLCGYLAASRQAHHRGVHR
jgi:NADP-dependent 3-hydroxy acid dehydrogenase YdfG